MKKSLSIKALLIVLTMCIIIAGLSACATDDTQTPTTPGEQPATGTDGAAAPNEPSGEISRERTMIWLVPDLPSGVDSLLDHSTQSSEAIRQLYDSAVYWPPIPDASGFLVPDFNNLSPWLAESIETSDDSLVYTVKLREGVMSHQGNELVAEDFVFERHRTARLVGINNFINMGLRITDLDQIQVLDRYTFQVTLDAPNPIFWPFMGHRTNHMIDSAAMIAHDTPDDPDAGTFYRQQGSGYGPYRLESFNPGDNFTFRAHENYWNKDNIPLYFERVIMKQIPQSANRLALVATGEADAHTYPTPAEMREAEGIDGVKVLSWRSNFVKRMEFNTLVEPFDNPLVRRALNYAVPIDEILETVYLGTATQSRSIIPSSYPMWTGDYHNYSLDYDKARELLAEAGYPDGFSTVIEIMADFPQEEQIAIIVRDSLRNIGVEAEIERLQSADFWTKGQQNRFEGLYIFNDFCGLPDAGFAVTLWAFSEALVNFGGYHNEEVDALYHEMMSTLNEQVRTDNLRRIQEIVVYEDPIWMFLVEPGYHLIVRDDIDGIFWNPSNEIFWSYAHRTR